MIGEATQLCNHVSVCESTTNEFFGSVIENGNEIDFKMMILFFMKILH